MFRIRAERCKLTCCPNSASQMTCALWASNPLPLPTPPLSWAKTLKITICSPEITIRGSACERKCVSLQRIIKLFVT